MSESEVAELHRHLRDIPLRAIEVNADSELFPDNWLFRWRWDKGRKAGKAKKKAVKDEEDVKPALEFLALVGGLDELTNRSRMEARRPSSSSL